MDWSYYFLAQIECIFAQIECIFAQIECIFGHYIMNIEVKAHHILCFSF